MVKSVKNLFQSTPMLKPSDINGVLISTNENSKYLAVSAFSNIRAGLAQGY